MLYREIGPSHPTTLAFHSIWPPNSRHASPPSDTSKPILAQPHTASHSLTQTYANSVAAMSMILLDLLPFLDG